MEKKTLVPLRSLSECEPLQKLAWAQGTETRSLHKSHFPAPELNAAPTWRSVGSFFSGLAVAQILLQICLS